LSVGLEVDLLDRQTVEGLRFQFLMPPGIQPPIVRAIQCVERSGAAAQPEFGQFERAAALRFRHLSRPGSNWRRFRRHPATAGGRQVSQIMVDIDPDKLLSRGLTPLDIVNAVNTQNLTLRRERRRSATPSIRCEPMRRPASINDLNMMPVKFANGGHRAFEGRGAGPRRSMVQQNIVRGMAAARFC